MDSILELVQVWLSRCRCM